MSDRLFSEPLPPGTVSDLSESLILVLPMPPSVNKLYATVFKRRVLSAEGRKFKRFVAKRVPVLAAPLDLDDDLRIGMVFCYPRLYKNGKRRRMDVSNRIKVLEDAITESLGEDDSTVGELRVRRRDTGSGGESWVEVAVSLAKPSATG